MEEEERREEEKEKEEAEFQKGNCCDGVMCPPGFQVAVALSLSLSLTIAPGLDGGLGGGAGVEAEVLSLETGAIQRRLRRTAVDLRERTS